MSTFSSLPNEDEQVLVQLVRDWEARGRAVIDEYLARYPHLAAKIRAFVQMQEKIEHSRPEVDPSVPRQLGEFRILRALAQGGMGEIYEALQERLHRRVAIKIIRRGRISPEARARFLREQMVLARLHQTHIVPIHTAGEEGPLQYFAMPYIEGAALHHVIRAAWQRETSQPRSKTPSLAQLAGMLATASAHAASAGSPDSNPGEAANVEGAAGRAALSAEAGAAHASLRAPGAPAVKLVLSLDYFRSAAQVLVDAAEALHHAHEAEILHRDVKPSNIMVDKLGQCWIIDFGLAGFLHAHGVVETPSANSADGLEPVTTSGLIGTLPYMAPEQFHGQADVRTDVWGLGVTLYELLTLRRAFPESPAPGHHERPAREEPVPPHELVANVPPDLTAICRKAMQEDPSRRYRTAEEFAEDLRRWLRLEPTHARPARTPRRVFLWSRRNKGWASAIVIALLGFLALAGVLITLADTERMAAEANADASQVRVAAAESRATAAEERERDRQREALLYQLQRLRLTTHTAGWSRDAWNLTEQASKIRKDATLTNEAAATLIGMDARIVKSFQGFDATSVVFDTTGRRLLMGGTSAYRDRRAEPGKVWDSKTDQLHRSQQAGAGPVAFRSDGTPLQLVPAEEDPGSLLLWDVTKQEALQRFKLPVQGDPETLKLALAPDGSFVAAAVALPDGKATLAIWESSSGKQFHDFGEKANALAFSASRGKSLSFTS